MSTIEQAAKRLEQLRKSGVEISDPAHGAAGAAATTVRREWSRLEPLRVARASRRNGVAASVPAQRPLPSLPRRRQRRRRQAGSRLTSHGCRASGYITPNAPRSRLAEEFRVIKRPLLNNARGSPRPRC